MRLTILLVIALQVVGIVSASAAGYLYLNNFTTDGPDVTYNPNSYGTPVGTGVGAGWTIGLYYAQGDVTALISPDPTGLLDPSILSGGLLTLGTGPGSTATIIDPVNYPGEFFNGDPFAASPAGDQMVTIMLVAYNGASYDTSWGRGHSAPFTMITAGGTDLPPDVGSFMPAFSVGVIIPEPATLALSGVGLTASFLFRRKIERNCKCQRHYPTTFMC